MTKIFVSWLYDVWNGYKLHLKTSIASFTWGSRRALSDPFFLYLLIFSDMKEAWWNIFVMRKFDQWTKKNILFFGIFTILFFMHPPPNLGGDRGRFSKSHSSMGDLPLNLPLNRSWKWMLFTTLKCLEDVKMLGMTVALSRFL